MASEARITCTLTESAMSDRLALARELGATALVGLEVADRRAVLIFEGHREEVDALAVAESRCCSFFDFEIEDRGGRVHLEILTPAGGEPLLRGLVAGVVAGWDGGLR